MKKLYSILLILTLSILFGCSNTSQSQTTNNNSFGNVNDLDSIYTFINETVTNISREDFNKDYTPYYFDINKDGHLDVCYNTKEWYGKLIFIASIENGYEVIKSDDNNMHKINSIDIDDDFIIVCGENINNAYGDERTDLYIITDNEIKFLNDFLISLLNGAQTYFEGEGSIEPINGYKEFNYIYNQYEVDEYDNREQHIAINMSYKFDEKTNKYITKEFGENYNYLTSPLDFKVLDDGGSSSNQDTIENLSGFNSETINGTYVNYSDYKCVIIPMNETQNSKSLSITNLNYGSNQYPVFFNVLGSLNDVTVTYTENIDTEPIVIEHYDVIDNSTVKICCKFDTDFSHIGITGKVYINSSEYEEVTFGLDDARDPSAYDIIMVK